MLYKKVNYSLIMYLFIFVISFNLTSCNNLSEKKDYKKKLEQSERLARNREEAKLLVNQSKTDLLPLNPCMRFLLTNFTRDFVVFLMVLMARFC